MSDPIRWRNDPSAPSSVRELLSQARATPPMPPDVQASLAQELAKLGAPPVAPTSMFASKVVLKVAAGIALAGAATWGGMKLLVRPAPVPPVPVTVVPSRSPVAGVEAPKAERVPAPQPVPRVTSTPARAPVTGDTLKAEEAVLEKARQLLASNPFQAFRLLEQHRHRFPTGQMSAEREALAIDALGQLGRTGEQKRRATTFLKHYATSPYVDHVKRSIEKR